MKPKIKDIEAEINELDIDSALGKLFSLQEQYGISLEKLISKWQKKKESRDKENLRLYNMSRYERELRDKGIKFIAGIDEAGRGPLAGPVVAACVILPEDIYIEKLNDSKKLSPKQRDLLFDIIIEKSVAYGVGIVDEKVIDKINILNATKKAMYEAVSALELKPEYLLIDAVELPDMEIEQSSIIKGDSLSVSIAAASIIAKVTRDRIMENMDELYPQYGFKSHKGYGSSEHINAIKKYGICPIHRVSFTAHFTT